MSRTESEIIYGKLEGTLMAVPSFFDSTEQLTTRKEERKKKNNTNENNYRPLRK